MDNDPAVQDHYYKEISKLTSKVRVLEDALRTVTNHMIPDVRTPQRMAKMDEPWKSVGNALMSDFQKGLKPPNKPIDELIQQYSEELCDFTNREYVKRVSLRYVQTMEDCQVRCLLYVLANMLEV